MRSALIRFLFCLAPILVFTSELFAQGTAQDYQRAALFQTGGHRRLLTFADVRPHWLEKSSRFWYRFNEPKGARFVLVDSTQNTSAPAFDHERLAAALSHAMKREVLAAKL